MVPVVGCGGSQVEPEQERAHADELPNAAVPSATAAVDGPSPSAGTSASAQPPSRLIAIYGTTEMVLPDKVFFPSGSHVIPKSAEPMLDAVAEVMKSEPKLVVEVEGHSDSSEPGGVALSGRRAGAVIAYLTKAGVPAARLTKLASAATRPLAPNDSTESRAKNRRVSFRVIEAP